MGMSVGGGHNGGGRRRGMPRYSAMAEINMTPFIDVMLVLLIIFMVSAPLLATGVQIDLPETKAGALSVNQEPITIAVDELGLISLNDQPVDMNNLLAQLQAKSAMSKEGLDQRIYIRGSKQVDYGKVVAVAALLTGAGYKKLALMTKSDGN